MIFAVLGACICTVTVALFAQHVVEPYFFRQLVRRRFSDVSVSHKPAQMRLVHDSRKLKLPKRNQVIGSNDEQHADALDAIGRELRLGASLHAAVIAAVDRHTVNEWHWLAHACREGSDIGALIRARLDEASDESNATMQHLALRAIAIAANGGDAVHAVETAARTLRSVAAIIAESQSSVAHTKASMKVLTWVPLVMAGWLFVRDADARRFFVSLPGIACLSFGIGLQFIGRRWVHRLARHAARVESDLPDFVDVIGVHLRSGQPPALAFLHASEMTIGKLGESARRVAAQIRNEGRFVDALVAYRHEFGLRAQSFIDALIDTERDGLPPRELFDRLAADAHAQRRRDADARLRALPVRLTLPLVGCILPAYLFLGVLPLLASQFSSVTFDLQ